MSTAYIKNLIDYNGNIIYPQTKASAVYDNNGDLLSNVMAYKPTITTVTLLASGWNDGAYSFETNYPNASYDIEVSLDSTATAEQAEAFNGAQIVGSATSNTIKAYGDVPTVDIPVIIKVVTK